MDNIRAIRLKIQELREIMQNMLACTNDNLLDPGIIQASKDLDVVLNEYEQILKKEK